MFDLDIAIGLACKAHYGQVDKAGAPYILHPLRLMSKFNNIEEKVVAILHDVVEDSDVSLDDLRAMGFSNDVLTAIDCLTKRDNEPYDGFISRIAANPLARAVKIEDIKDNLDITRLDTIKDGDIERLQKYHKYLKYLSSL